MGRRTIKLGRRSNALGQGRGLRSAFKARALLNEKHTAVVSLPFIPDSNDPIVEGSTNTMQAFRLTTDDLFSYAPRIGDALKYNNARLIMCMISSVASASLSTVGNHAAWALFDQQYASWPETGSTAENDAAIETVLTVMQQTGQFKLGSATTRLEFPVSIPRNIKSFNFQDVEPVAEGDVYDPTTVMKIVRIFPKGAPPVTNVNIEVEFSGLSGINTPNAPFKHPAQFDVLYNVDNVNLEWMRKAFDDLARPTPYDTPNDINWRDGLFMLAIGPQKQLYKFDNKDDILINSGWQKILFPNRTDSGKLESRLSQVCCDKIADPRLADGEFYYAHAPKANWFFDNTTIAGGIYVRADNALSVHQREAREILAEVVNDHGMNVYVGQKPVEVQ